MMRYYQSPIPQQNGGWWSCDIFSLQCQLLCFLNLECNVIFNVGDILRGEI